VFVIYVFRLLCDNSVRYLENGTIRGSRAGIRTQVPGAKALDLGDKPPKIPRESIITDTSVRIMKEEKTHSKANENLPSEVELFTFYNDCIKKVSRETCKQYVNYLRKQLDANNKASILAWKKYYKWKGDIEKWKAIKTKKSGVDLKVRQ